MAVGIKTKIAILSIAAFTLGACNRYSAAPTEGWVIDSDTKKPIEGVIVVANWQLHKSTIGGKIPAAHLNVMETHTDSNGLFFFDGWEPRTAQWGFFIDRDPELLFYKDGYLYRGLKNPSSSEVDDSKVRRSVWNGKTIELERFNGNLNDYATHLSSLHTSLHSILHGSRCEWKRTPNIVLAVAKQEKIFRDNEVNNVLTSLADISGYFCGSAEEHLKSLGVLPSIPWDI